MSYVFSGRLIGLLCDDCSEPLVGATVRLVSSASGTVSRDAAADPKQTAVVLEESAADARVAGLLGEAVVGEDGSFRVELAEGYDGGEAFDVDIFCGTMTGHKVPPKPLSFTLTTLAPQWRTTDGGFEAAWSYEIPHRIWCGIRGRLGWWSICGHVRVCDTKIAVPGVKVSAFDVDWLQDDALGSAVTDGTGHFRIDYTADAFTRTPWSPWLNIELVAGPDVYFRIDGPTGVLLQEPSSRGRQSDRQNVGPCFCVDLCVKDVPGGPDPYPWFDHIGGYKTLTGFDSAPGGTGRTLGDSRAFYAGLRLNGVLGRLFSGQPAEYRFEYDSGAGWQPVRPAQMVAMQIGTWQRLTGVFPPVETKSVVVLGANGPDEIAVVPDADGWVAVPQDNSLTTGLFVPNNNLLGLNSAALSAQTHNVAGIVAGQSTAPAGLAVDEYVALRMVLRVAGQSATQVQAGIADRVALANTTYDQVQKQGSWVPTRVDGQLGVVSLDIQELIGHGCARITNALHVNYTAAHPNLGSMSLTITGPNGPYHYALPPISQDYFGSVHNLLDSANHAVAISSLPKCSYILAGSIDLLLTTGDSSPLPLGDQIAFTTQ